METNLYNNYLFKAIENYPYELEKAIEALNYALSYNPKSVKALCLMARIQNEQLGDYELAKEYYEKALMNRLDIPDVYPDYIRLLINNEDYEEAQKLIDFARQIKGIDKAGIELTQASLFEANLEFDKARKSLNDAKLLGMNNDFINYVDEVISRVNKKLKIQNKINREAENKKTETVDKPETSWFRNRLNNLL